MPILTPEERIGATLEGKYVLQRILASGGMATVFVGLHEWTHRAVAVKILNYEYAREEEVVRRFLQEARAASHLKHPHVVDVLDMGRAEDGTVYLVMELLEGETLKARMRRAPMTLDEIASSLVPVMSAVAVAHKKGVIHRDLKPDNIFLARDDERIVPKLLDFGIAKVASGDSGSTRTGAMVGTPQYMAPEQARGERDVGPPADVWSMGVVLYACLARRLPFQGDSTAALLAKLLVEAPTPIAQVAPALPRPIVDVIDRALLRDPSQRFASMAEMQVALERALAEARMPASPPPQPVVDVGTAGAPRSEPPGLAPETPFAWAPIPAAPIVGAPAGRSRGWRVAVAALALVVIAIGGGAAWSMAAREQAVVVTPLGAESRAGARGRALEAQDVARPETAGGGAEIASGATAALGGDTVAAAGEEETEAESPLAAEAQRPITADAEGQGAAEAESTTEPERPTERAAATARATTTRATAREADRSSGARSAAASTADRGAPPGGRREPRRGTRGALILR